MTTFNVAFFFFFFNGFFFLHSFPVGGGVGGGNLLTVYLLSPLHLLACSQTCPQRSQYSLYQEFSLPATVANCMVFQRRIEDFLMEAGVDYNNRPSNYTLIYFKLSYVCPKTWRFRKDEGWLASQGFCDPRISIFFGPHIFPFVFPRNIFFWCAVLKGAG